MYLSLLQADNSDCIWDVERQFLWQYFANLYALELVPTDLRLFYLWLLNNAPWFYYITV
jgi:hypothetical protein